MTNNLKLKYDTEDDFSKLPIEKDVKKTTKAGDEINEYRTT
jgi:hypothetical protein